MYFEFIKMFDRFYVLWKPKQIFEESGLFFDFVNSSDVS